MISNAPDFDPLSATPDEGAEMVAGYMAAGDDVPKPAITSPAFDHGWRMRRNDMAGVVDDDQRELARRIARRGEGQHDRLRRLETDIARFRRGGRPVLDAAESGIQTARPAAREQARAAGYTGDPCSTCGSFTTRRAGTCLVCDRCGSTTGCS